MNHDEPEPQFNPTPPGRAEVDALLDGESVDKEQLRSALNDAGARDYLIDALLLRQLTREIGPSHFMAPGTPRGPLARGVRWIAACAILAAGAGGGYVYGQRTLPQATPASSFEVFVDTAPMLGAPQPTQVFRFEPGVNWTTTTGSN